MRAQLKITSSLRDRVLENLRSPHEFAFERVGYLLCNPMDSEQSKLIAFDYISVPDEFYIKDKTCGARFSGEAVRLGMQLALERSCCVLHVHTHEYGVYPSETDKEELPGVAQSIVNVNSVYTHGWVILTKTAVYGELIFPSGSNRVLKNLSVVGVPLVIRSCAVEPSIGLRSNEDESRQSFLGTNFESMAKTLTVGIVGLGGGGSHIVQQLAHIGIRQFLLCDNDQIEDTNLNRLVGATVADVERNEFKSSIAQRIIANLQPEAFVDAMPGVWEDKVKQLIKCDLVFGCLDSFSGRRDLEAFCRRSLIPLIDIGMDVLSTEWGYEIYGQVALSLPGRPCLQCLGVVNDGNLEGEAADYGEAGPKPQVVWPNGILASSAVGLAISLLSNWSGCSALPLRLDYCGSTGVMTTPPTLQYVDDVMCPHYTLENTGRPKYKKV